ncbi:MAG: DUF177 domain-containing protein [Myxococcota bacterium]
MQLAVERLTSEPSPFVFEAGDAWWSARMQAQESLPRTLAVPFAVRGEAYRGRHGDDLVLEGQIEGALELECGRCLARYRHALREPFRLLLEPAGSRVPTEPEAVEALARDGLCLADELELGWYRGTEIQLDAVCLEVISLALPVQPLCKEDCAGLCSHCGADRNQAACGCDDTPPNSPFAVLASLRGGSREGVQ